MEYNNKLINYLSFKKCFSWDDVEDMQVQSDDNDQTWHVYVRLSNHEELHSIAFTTHEAAAKLLYTLVFE